MINQDKKRSRKLINTIVIPSSVCLSQVIVILTSCLEKKTGNKSPADRICSWGLCSAAGGQGLNIMELFVLGPQSAMGQLAARGHTVTCSVCTVQVGLSLCHCHGWVSVSHVGEVL